ncbi:MAG: cytochrome c biogenesis protein ResB [Anaerolineae bacterium]|nr:cytochrome c biogenesis protein ResB [Anaerolineae bacterium]
MADDIPASRLPRLEPISVVWHAFAAPHTLLVLMALLALTLAATGLIPQPSPDGLNESESWLAVERGALSRYTELARAVGLFDLYHAFWFRLLLALIALALVVRTVNAVELAWRAGWRQEWQALPHLPWLRHAQQVDLTVPVGPDQAREVSVELLAEEGYDWAEVAANGRTELLAVYRPRRLWLRPLAYGGLLVAGAALLIAVAWGWQGEAWQPMPLEIQAVGHGTADAVRLDAFDMRFDTQGQLVDYRSRITWLRDGTDLQPDVARIGQPARLDGIALRQVAYTPVVRLRAQADDGRSLLLQVPGQPTQGRELVTVRFLSSDDQPLVFLPQRERFFTLAFEPDCTANGPAVHLYKIEPGGQQRQRMATLHNSGQVTLDDVQLDVELGYVPVLRFDYRPGACLVLAGLGAGLIALIALGLLPTRLLWLRAIPRGDGTTQIECKTLAGPRTRQHLRSLLARLAEGIESED